MTTDEARDEAAKLPIGSLDIEHVFALEPSVKAQAEELNRWLMTFSTSYENRMEKLLAFAAAAEARGRVAGLREAAAVIRKARDSNRDFAERENCNLTEAPWIRADILYSAVDWIEALLSKETPT